jgi:prepilin-type N-terminal cleavage/methylation domain-containing protein
MRKSHSIHKKYGKSDGFTLIELLVVIAIMSLLSSFIFASLQQAKLKALNTAKTQAVVQLKRAATQYYWDKGNYYYDGLDNWYCVGLTPSQLCMGLLLGGDTSGSTALNTAFQEYLTIRSSVFSQSFPLPDGYDYRGIIM